MSTLFIEDVVLRGKHGVEERERNESQDFRVDISVEVDTNTAAQSDSLDDTVDYVYFLNIARTIVENRSFRLLETLAETIASNILRSDKVESVTVSVRKPHVLENGVPGISITRTR